MAAVAGPVDPISAFSISYGGQSCGGTHGVDDAAAHAARSRLLVHLHRNGPTAINHAAIGDPCHERSTQSSSLPQERYAYAIAFEAAASSFSPRTAIRNPAKFMVWSGMWR